MGYETDLQDIKDDNFKEKKRHWKGNITKTIMGIKVELIEKKDENQQASLPFYSNNIFAYVTFNKKIKNLHQLALYDTKTHERVKDFDWNHQHGKFKKGDLHVHDYGVGNFKNRKEIEPREPTKEEIIFIKQVFKEFGYDYTKAIYDKD